MTGGWYSEERHLKARGPHGRHGTMDRTRRYLRPGVGATADGGWRWHPGMRAQAGWARTMMRISVMSSMA